LEFPHLLQLIRQNQFDTIYHEHFSYFSLMSTEKIFEKNGLEIFDVEKVATHGGSLRVFLQHAGGKRRKELSVDLLLREEREFGLDRMETYFGFSEKIDKLRRRVCDFFWQVKRQKKKIAGYGAPAKGNTLLNYCQIDEELLPFTVDLNPYKQNLFLPGSKIPIFSPSKIEKYRPDYLFILPWNLQEEIKKQMASIRNFGAKFVVAIPDIAID